MSATFKSFEAFVVLIGDSPVANVSGIHHPRTPRFIARAGIGDKIDYGESQCNPTMFQVVQLIKDIPVGRSTNDIRQIVEDVVNESKSFLAKEQLSDSRGNESFDQGVVRHVRALVLNTLLATLAKHNGVPLWQTLLDYVNSDSRMNGYQFEKKRDAVDFAFYGFFNLGTDNARLAGLDYEQSAIRGNAMLSYVRDRRVWDNVDDVVDFFRKGLELTGCKSAKLKGGVFDPWYEVRVMKALKAEMPKINWIWDPNGAMQTAELAHEICGELASICQFIEDPVLTQETMSETQRLLGKFPLATNMCAPDMAAHESARKSRAFDISLACLLYTSPSPRDQRGSRMPSSA